MTSIRQSLRSRAGSVLPLGAMASLLSMAALALRGHAETGSAASPFNAVSHRLRSGRALRLDTADLRHTALGAAVHAGSSVFWAALYDEAVCRRQPAPSPAGLVAGAAGVAALAAAADFALVPDRPTPGVQRRLSQRSLVLTYTLFAAGLALGGLAARRWR
ncbi:MAG TPA: hypothetical protein VFY73_27920 [Ideonella sp.]|uniref:hypothetical protein n=1 Tax=Ideonella sp. TaxID=1929293 RepID=UPI002E35AE04|nr:hypothetical protein [Ideonella sp.]HEX5687861.1 hypothetical protein [Ideonella sp.]